MAKKRPNQFLDGEAQEDSAEESDTEKKQRVAAIKKLKRPSKFSQQIYFHLFFFYLFSLVSDDDDDDEDEEIMDEKTAKELEGFIAEPGDEVNYEIFKEVLFFLHRKKMKMQMINRLRVNQTMKMTKLMMMI